MGWVYTGAAVVSGVFFLAEAHRLRARARARAAESVLKPMRLFHFSITYLTILFVGVAIDPLVHLPLPGLS
jgi:protoheme IX farnesyltransferase